MKQTADLIRFTSVNGAKSFVPTTSTLLTWRFDDTAQIKLFLGLINKTSAMSTTTSQIKNSVEAILKLKPLYFLGEQVVTNMHTVIDWEYCLYQATYRDSFLGKFTLLVELHHANIYSGNLDVTMRLEK